MPALSSNITVTYGGESIGGSTDRKPHGPYRLTIDYDRLTVEVPFVVTSGLSGDIDALETAFRTREGDLTITHNGKTTTYKPSTGTGFNHRGTLIKPGNSADTRVTRYYLARVECELPADQSGKSGRKNDSYTVTTHPSGRQTLTFRGEYSGTTGTVSASANFDAAFPTYRDSIKTALSATTWETEEKSRQKTVNDADSLVTYEVVVEGIIADQESGTTDSTSLVDPTLIVRRILSGAEDTPAGGTVLTPTRAAVSYTADVVTSVATGSSLVDTYTGTIRPWIIDQLETILDASIVVLIDEQPSYNYRDNQVTVSMTVEGLDPTGPASVYRYRLTTNKARTAGTVLPPLWAGGEYSKAELPGPGQLQLVISETFERVGTLDDLFSMAFDAFGVEGMSLGPFGVRPKLEEIAKVGTKAWKYRGQTQRVTALTRGIEPHTANVLHVVLESTFERADTPPTLSG